MKKLMLILLVIPILAIAHGQYMDEYTSKFNPGHYYTLDGKRVAGEIKISCAAKFGTLPHNSFYFKGSDGKQERFTTKDASSFVIGTDSFMIIKNVEHGDAKLAEDYAHVDAVDGNITTVTHYTTVGGGGDTKITGLTLYIKNGIAYTSLKEAQKSKK